MQPAELTLLLADNRQFLFSPRRPAGRPITAHLLRWQLVDITPG
jgi:hypothetical protein